MLRSKPSAMSALAMQVIAASSKAGAGHRVGISVVVNTRDCCDAKSRAPMMADLHRWHG